MYFGCKLGIVDITCISYGIRENCTMRRIEAIVTSLGGNYCKYNNVLIMYAVSI